VLLHWGVQALLRLFISSSPMHHWMALEVVGFAFKICSFDTFQKLDMPSPLALGSACASEFVYFFFSLASLDGIIGGWICF
jgi:hypothetical protein